MRSADLFPILLATCAAATSVSCAATKQSEHASTEKVVFVSADQANYRELAPGASAATLSGDPDQGANRMLVRFAPGAEFPLHMHTHAQRIVVIRGAYVYRPEHGREVRVGPGSYLDLPPGDRHASGGDAREGALFFSEVDGPFDLHFIAAGR